MKTKHCYIFLALLFFFTALDVYAQEPDAGGSIAKNTYLYSGKMLGIGGGGAMSGFSPSPYNDLWFVGTDMGTLFRSDDSGVSWYPVNHFQTTYDSDLPNSAPVGFSSDGLTVFHAPGGRNPVRSVDGGISWHSISVNADRIRYFIGSSTNPDKIYAFTNTGVLYSSDRGISWNPSTGIYGDQVGSFIDVSYVPERVYSANNSGIYMSNNGGLSFSLIHSAPLIRFAGGRDESGITLAYLSMEPEACSFYSGGNCGFVYVNTGAGFIKTSQYGGKWITMAENDACTIYVTGDREWERDYGTKVWKSSDKGSSWELIFHQYNWDVTPYAPWPADRLEYSAVGLDVGWWDSGYYWFTANQLDSSVIGGSENFFLHVSVDGGEHWLSPFTEFADDPPREEGKNWTSTGLEVTSVRFIKWHPAYPGIGYASLADIGGLVTEDRGITWRIINTLNLNTFYDYAFDPSHRDRVYAAAGSQHDWPHDWYGNVTQGAGGLFMSNDLGRTWSRITPEGYPWNRQFLSIAYDSVNDILYGGSQSIGIARRKDGAWSWDNAGLGPAELDKIIPVIKINPSNYDVYCLLSGNKPQTTNHYYTGIYKKGINDSAWVHLRGTVNRPPGVDEQYLLWVYPTHFDIDFSTGVMFLTDIENAGQWLATGVWRSLDNGSVWNRVIQFTHPFYVEIDNSDPDRIYACGSFSQDWGNGGPYYSQNLGETWQKDVRIPLQHNPYSFIPDPLNAGYGYYTFFGGGTLYYKKPSPDLYSVILHSEPQDPCITLSGAGDYYDGETVNISAVSDAGYTFIQWTGNPMDILILDNPYSPATSFIMPDRDIEFTAFFSITIPEAPSNLQADALSTSQIYLTWSDNSQNEDGFKIERKTGQQGKWNQVATVSANTTMFINTGLNTATTYYYRVRAYNISGDSGYSNEAGATTLEDGPGAPVYRFFNTVRGGHLYTISEYERNYIMENLPEWYYEGIKFAVYDDLAPDTCPAYRFFNTVTGIHLYTISEDERDAVIQLPEWNYEGIKFYVYAVMADNAIPVYRFFNHVRGGHLYTVCEYERDSVMQLPEWTYEGIPFYVLSL